MDADNPTIENAAEYIQRLQTKYGVTPEANGNPNAVLDKEQLLALLVRMEQANEEIRAERDDHQHNLLCMMEEKFGNEPLPPLPPEGEWRDFAEVIKELEEQMRNG
jgi:hypothetical protein